MKQKEYEELAAYHKQTIKQYPVLTTEEQNEVIRDHINGCPVARDKLIKHNLGLVVKIANRFAPYTRGRLNLNDIIQEGNVGLIRAINKIEPHRIKHREGFGSFIAISITRHIIKAIHQQSYTVHIPHYMQRRMYEIETVKQEYQEKQGREPTLEELSEHTNLSEKVLRNTLTRIPQIYSIDAQIDDENTQRLTPENLLTYSHTESVYNTQSKDTTDKLFIEELLSRLTKRERYIITQSFGLNGSAEETLETIGNALKISKQRVDQIKKEVMRKITQRLKGYGYEL